MTAIATATELAQRAHAVRRTVVEMCRGRGQGSAGQGRGSPTRWRASTFRTFASIEAYARVHYIRAGDELWAKALEELA